MNTQQSAFTAVSLPRSQVAGLITRHELTHEYLHDVSHKKKRKHKARRPRNRRGVINDNSESTATLDSEVFSSDQ